MTVKESKIICARNRPIQAVISGKTYVLDDQVWIRIKAGSTDRPLFSHDQENLFKPDPISQLAAAGIKADADGFMVAAETICRTSIT